MRCCARRPKRVATRFGSASSIDVNQEGRQGADLGPVLMVKSLRLVGEESKQMRLRASSIRAA
jgi:hypothetical protein